MKITVTTAELLHAATVACQSISREAVMPVLQNVLIESRDGAAAIFHATNMEQRAAIETEATVDETGRVTVPAQTLRDIAKVLPTDETVTLQTSGRNVELTCGRNRYKLATLPADEFPQWPAQDVEASFTIPATVLRRALESVAYAIPTKDHRRALLGVHCQLDGGEITLTATDGKKLARVKVQATLATDSATEAQAIIPRGTVEAVLQAMPSEGSVAAAMNVRSFEFKLGAVTIQANAIDQKYPNCDAVIPRDFPLQVPIPREAFTRSAQRAGITADDKNKSIVLKFEGGACEFNSMAHDVGVFSGSVPVSYEGETLELAFNFRYMMETLGRFGKPEVFMLAKNPNAPIVFKEDVADSRALHLLMPIKLSDIRPPAPASADGEEEEGEE